MRENGFQKAVADKFGKPLKDIMYELSVIRNVILNGRIILHFRVSEDVFAFWRKKNII